MNGRKRKGRGTKRLVAAVALAIGVPTVALAAMTVNDPGVLAKASAHLNELKKQIQVLTEARNAVDATARSIGEATRIVLPAVNTARLAGRLRRDAQCLLPDLKQMLPSVDFKDIELGTLCGTSGVYRQSLFTGPARLEGATADEHSAAREAVKAARKRVLADASLKGVAQADVVLKSANDAAKAADDLKASADAATTTNQRLRVVNEGQVLQARLLIQQNQLLAQMLKVQAATALDLGVNIEETPAFEVPPDEGPEARQ